MSLPKDCPVKPLGRNGDSFHFLNATGQHVVYSASALDRPAVLTALFAGPGVSATQWLKEIGPPVRKGRADDSFNAQRVNVALVQACTDTGIFDITGADIRRVGTWRGEADAPLVHAGARLLYPEAIEDPAGITIDGKVYPVCPSITSPAPVPVDPVRFDDFAADFRALWNWRRPQDPDILLGMIGLGFLGAFPEWRSHLWISGPPGSGKSTIAKIASDLLSGMSTGVIDGTTEAGVRAMTDGQARVRIFDEQETDGSHGQTEQLVELLRRMSGSEGARIQRSSANHDGVQFRLHGMGIMVSVNPAIMTPADRSRWIMVDVRQRQPSLKASEILVRVKEEARELGPEIWRRMVNQAPGRFDHAAQLYCGLVETMGGGTRAGDSIGAMLAGWDLLFFDGPPDEARLDRARWLAEPLVEDACQSTEDGVGEQCLRHLLTFLIQSPSGGTASVAEIIQRNLAAGPTPSDQALLARVGMRLLLSGNVVSELFVIGGPHPMIDRALANTPWRGGGHRKALLMLPEVTASSNPIRVAGSKSRGVLIPQQYLPKQDNDAYL